MERFRAGRTYGMQRLVLMLRRMAALVRTLIRGEPSIQYDRISMEIAEVSRTRRSRRDTVYAGGDIQMDALWKKHQLLVTYSHADMLVRAESIEPRW